MIVRERERPRARTRAQREAVHVVRAWRAWIAEGGNPKTRPQQPTNHQFKLAARAGL